MGGFTIPGGSTIQPALVAYRPVTLNASITLVWPNQSQSSTDFAARVMNVTAGGGPYTMSLPPANQVSTGFDLLIVNVGSNNFNVANNGGTTLATLTPGQAYYFNLTDNTTVNGVWFQLLFGAGSSSLSAGSVANSAYDIIAIGSYLHANLKVINVSTGPLNINSDGVTNRGQIFEWTGGSGVVNLPLATAVGNGFFSGLVNWGTGSLTITPGGSDTIDTLSTQTLAPGNACFVMAGPAGQWFTLGRGLLQNFNFTEAVIGVTGGTLVETLSQAQNVVQKFTGVLASAQIVTLPGIVQVFYVQNSTTGGYALTIGAAGGGSSVTVPQGINMILFSDGTNVINASNNVLTTAVALQLLPGTVSAPSLSFVGYGSTGIYQRAANTFDWAVQGVQAMELSALGNLLIGNNTTDNGQAPVQMQATLGGSGGFASGMQVSGAILSTATSRADLFQAAVNTQAAAFTATRVDGYQAQFSSLGAGSAITTLCGYNVDASWAKAAGITNVYGYQSQVPAASGAWNLYINGAAINYLAGNLLVGTTSDLGAGFPLQLAATSAGSVRGNVTNNSTGAGVEAGWEFQTGTANSYAVLSIFDNSGSPYARLFMGSALTTFTIIGGAGVSVARFMPSGVDNTATVGNLGIASINNGPLAGFRNRIINGDIRVDQRNNGAAQTITAAASAAYTVDRFYATCTGANVTGQRVAGSAPDQYVYQFTGAASVTGVAFGQRIEATNVYDLTSTTATFSVKLSNSLLTTVTWTAYYPTVTDNWTARTQIATGTFTVNSTLTKYSVQIALGANITAGLEIELSVGAQTSGTWQITEFQLEYGPSATPFERRPIGAELLLCQRYLPSWVGASTTDYLPGAGSVFISTSVAAVLMSFPVPARVAPTGIAYSAVGSFTLQEAGIASSAATVISFVNAGAIGGRINVTGTGTPYTLGTPAAFLMNTGGAALYWTGAEL